jgi:hypothetical protein
MKCPRQPKYAGYLDPDFEYDINPSLIQMREISVTPFYLNYFSLGGGGRERTDNGE